MKEAELSYGVVKRFKTKNPSLGIEKMENKRHRLIFGSTKNVYFV